MLGFSWSNSDDTSSHSKDWYGNEIGDTNLTCYLIEEVVDANGFVDDRVSVLGANDGPAKKPRSSTSKRALSNEQHEALSKFFNR